MSEDQLPNILRYVSPIDARTVAQVARQLVVENVMGVGHVLPKQI